MCDVSKRDLGIELFGHHYPSPVIAAPVGVLELVHRDADLAVARATAELGIPYIFSNQALRSMEQTAAVMGSAPRWFQLYWSRSGEPRTAVETFLDVFSRSSLTWPDLAFARKHTSLQLDGAIGSLDALPAIVEAVNGRMPVLSGHKNVSELGTGSLVYSPA